MKHTKTSQVKTLVADGSRLASSRTIPSYTKLPHVLLCAASYDEGACLPWQESRDRLSHVVYALYRHRVESALVVWAH